MRKSMRGNKTITILVLCLALFMTTAGPGFAQGGPSDISEAISLCEEAVTAAESALEAAEKRYEDAKAKAEAKITVTDEDLEGTGREFIDSLVKTCYDTDKTKTTSASLLKKKELTVKGCMDRAKANAACKTAIDKIEASAQSEDYTFEGRVNRSLSLDNLYKAITYMKTCNTLRVNETDSDGKSLGLKPYRVSPYLMASAAVSAAIGSYTKTHTCVYQNILVTFNGKKAYENISWGKADPFPGWYTAEKNGTWPSKAHYNQIISSNFKQTGANWNDQQIFSQQCFTSDTEGTSYAVSKFKKLLDQFVEDKKLQIIEQKKSTMSIFNTKPSYLVKAETALETAKTNLRETVEGYTPEIAVTCTSYNTLKVTYEIPEGYTGIKIYRSTTGENGTYKLRTTLKTGTEYVNSGITCGKTFYYKVKLYKKIDGKLVYSKLSDKVEGTPLPGKVKGVKATKTKKGKLALSWKEIKGATDYDIYVRRSGEKKFALLKIDKTIRGLTLETREAGTLKARAVPAEPATYIIKIRAYRMVNGTKVKGEFSEDVNIEL